MEAFTKEPIYEGRKERKEKGNNRKSCFIREKFWEVEDNRMPKLVKNLLKLS